MAFRIRLPDNIVVEVDSEQEMAAVFRHIRGQQLPLPLAEAPAGAVVAPTQAALRAMLRGLPRPQAILVRSLAAAPQGLRDNECRALLGFETNNQLAGTMRGLTGSGAKHNLQRSDFLVKEVHNNGAGRYIIYRLTDTAREVMAG